jgi:Xaa-Pro dipeptidase
MMPLGEAFYRRTVARIQAALEPLKLDGLLLLDTYDVIYASGFVHSATERPLGLYIPARGDPALFVPLLEQENAADTWIGDIRIYFEYPSEEHPVRWMLRESGARRLGVDHISPQLWQQAGDQVVLTPLVEQMRWIKQPEEIALVEQAAGYADFCLEYVRDHAADLVRGGATELDILNACMSATVDKMVRELGATYGRRGLKVTGTVHSGSRAALPHGEPGERQPQPGEPLIAGIGAMVGGYHAESGATFILGEPQGDQMDVLAAMAACDAAAVDTLRPGGSCAAVNEAALQALRAAGLGDAIRHRIGHGMGLQGHEGPWLAPGDSTILVPGMVFSNEPGVYRPGVDGYRTINSMIVTNGAARVVSGFLAAHPPAQRVIAL